ncbi:hypothetical protein R5M74_09945 [Aeromonas hydrophila]|nr:hypothetical protein R5M74_09945 [Aeromonas hydrophila]
MTVCWAEPSALFHEGFRWSDSEGLYLRVVVVELIGPVASLSMEKVQGAFDLGQGLDTERCRHIGGDQLAAGGKGCHVF